MDNFLSIKSNFIYSEEQDEQVPATKEISALCRFGCGKKILLEEQASHEQLECDNYIVECPSKSSFCGWRGARCKLQEHTMQCQFASMAPVISVIFNQFRDLLTEGSDRLELKIQQQMLTLQDQNAQLQKQMEQQQREINQLRDILQHSASLTEAMQEELQPKPRHSSVPTIPLAKNLRWKLQMSSKWPFTENTYESLVDYDLKTGAATNLYHLSWIQASFDEPVYVTAITLAPVWDPSYLNERILQYSENNANWVDLWNIQGIEMGKNITFTLPSPLTAQYWRIIGKGYVAISTWIFL